MTSRAKHWYQSAVRRAEQLMFASRRADYYDYLAAVLDGTQGAITLRDIFFKDATRYGPRSLRGRLSQRWLHGYQRSGGDLYATWADHIPHGELALIRAAQRAGNEAVVKTIAQLAHVRHLLHEASRLVLATLWPAMVSLLLMLGLSAFVPRFTVPRLRQTFSQVDPEHYGPLTQRLFGLAEFMATWQAIVPFVVMVVVVALVWSLPNLTGQLRRYLDHFLWWDSYRCVTALRFLSFLQIILGEQDQSATRLSAAFMYQRTGASPWLGEHIDTMLAHVHQGKTGADIFDTRLLDRHLYWFFSDMFVARGLRDALALVTQRLQRHIVGDMARRAAVFRWLVLITGVAYALLLTLWHYAVIDELRQVLSWQFSGF